MLLRTTSKNTPALYELSKITFYRSLLVYSTASGKVILVVEVSPNASEYRLLDALTA